ncbi:MAG: fumarate hydratase [Sedimentisphaerales bacterium]|nr:fumarate hydratase [Sedimentisphaerales bacterium]
MITISTIQTAMYEAMCRAVTLIPPDVKLFLARALEEETESLAKAHLELTLKNAEQAGSGDGLICGDTGYPLFFVTVGRDVEEIEGGFASLSDCAGEATVKATEDCFLRPTMVEPLTRSNPGNNLGNEMPQVNLEFDNTKEGIEIWAVPKGGGSEIFGTFYRMLYPSDGIAAVKKFVVDSVYQGCYSGKICPPAIVGIGIGGTADICMKLAKKAAVLVPLGTSNTDPLISKLEKELMEALRGLGLGPMGSRGANAVLSLHIKTAMTHTAALPVAVNAQCSICRRHKAVITRDGQVSYTREC